MGYSPGRRAMPLVIVCQTTNYHMQQTNKIDWVLRDIDFNLDLVKERLSDLSCDDKIDSYNPDSALATKLGDINDAIGELQEHLTDTYGASDED